MSHPTYVRRTKGLSIILISIITLSALTAITPLVLAQTAPPNTYNVNWTKGPFNQANNWTWNNIQWLFGPRINATIALLNGTLLCESGQPTSHYLYPYEQFCVNISVPKSMFETGRNASQIQFSMMKSGGYQNQTTQQFVQLWNAQINMQCGLYTNEQGGYGNCGGGPSGPSGQKPPIPNWSFYSQFQNYSVTGGSSGTGPANVPGPAPQQKLPSIFQPNLAACKYIETPDCYYVYFQGQLNSSSAVTGNFCFSINVMDTKGSNVGSTLSGSSVGQGPGGSITVIKPDPNAGNPNQPWYNFDITDTTGEINNIVTPGTEFEIVFDIEQTKDVKNVTLYMNPPVDGNWWGNTTSTHPGTLPENTQNLTPSMCVWCNVGYHWNGTTNSWQTGGYWLWANREVRITANTTGSGNFRIDEGYYYTIFNAPTWDMQDQTSVFLCNVTGSSNFFDLNKTASTVYDSSSGNGRQVTFVIRVKPSANASAGQYWFGTSVFKTDGTWINGGGNSNFDILGANVVKMMLMELNSDDVLTKVTPGKFFRAGFEVTGTQAFQDALLHHTTNITFQFNSPGTCGQTVQIGDWQHSTGSQLQYWIDMNTTDGVLSVELYNSTCSNWWNSVTGVENGTSSQVKIADWSSYLELGSPSFLTSYNVTSNDLTLAFNLTFEPGVQTGWYWWNGHLSNRTYSNGYILNGTQWVPYTFQCDQDYQCINNESLRCTVIQVPNTSNIQVGEVAGCWDYWGATQKWTTDPTTGALDLNGNNATQNDDFYVKSIYNSTNYWSQSGTSMMVNIGWGRYQMNSNFALINYTWSNVYTQTYCWYYAGNKSHVPQSRFDALINSTIWDLTDNAMRPEYSQIAQYTINMTWDKIVAEYSNYDWWQPRFSWNWLEVSFNQNFFTPGPQGDISNNLFFQFAGLLLFNDTKNDGVLDMGFVGGQPVSGDLTHYFMLENASGIDLRTPQPGVDNGSMQVSVNSTVSWGVSVHGIKGTTYPTNVYGLNGFGGLNWWWHDSLGKYVTTGNFSTVPSKVGIDNLNFTAHFSIPNANMTIGAVNQVRIKVDEGVGAWTLYDQPQSELSNYSLALAFLASSAQWQQSQYSMQTSKGTVTTENSTASDSFNITTQSGVKLANIQLGGFNYTWGKDDQNYSMHSSTTPMSAFSAMYSGDSMGGNGAGSVTSFSVTGMNYFVESAFKKWGGYAVSTDPYFAVYTTNNMPTGISGSAIAAIVTVLAVLCVTVTFVVRRRSKGKKSKQVSLSTKVQ